MKGGQRKTGIRESGTINLEKRRESMKKDNGIANIKTGTEIAMNRITGSGIKMQKKQKTVTESHKEGTIWTILTNTEKGTGKMIITVNMKGIEEVTDKIKTRNRKRKRREAHPCQTNVPRILNVRMRKSHQKRLPLQVPASLQSAAMRTLWSQPEIGILPGR